MKKYYHATSGRFVRSIVENGLRAPTDSVELLMSGSYLTRSGIFVNDSLRHARDWADIAAQIYYEKTHRMLNPVILELDLLGLEHLLVPDERAETTHDYRLNVNQIEPSRIKRLIQSPYYS